MRTLLSALLIAVAASLPARAENAPVVAVAANVADAATAIAERFRAQTGLAVRLSVGSSGNLVRQIRQGAPFELFLSADEAFALRLVEDGLTVDRGAVYAIGRLAYFVPAGSPLAPDPSLQDLAAALADGRLKRLAMANPELAPYGRATQDVLERAQLWRKLQGKIILGENASQAAKFAMTSGVQAGFMPSAVALSPAVSAAGRHVLIPEAWHTALSQRMVLLKSAGATARRFYAFLQGPEARAILARHGYALPH